MMAIEAVTARGPGIARLRARLKRQSGNRLRLDWRPGEPYAAILSRAFPIYAETVRDAAARGEARSCLLPATVPLAELRRFLRLLGAHYAVEGDLDEQYALALHRSRPHRPPPPWQQALVDLGLWQPPPGYTRIARLIHRAKGYFGKPIDRRAAEELARECLAFVRRHPTLRRADLILPIPPSVDRGVYSLPSYIAARLSAETGMEAREDRLWRTADAPPMKGLYGEAKRMAAEGLFEADSRLAGLKVLLVDDICREGVTISVAGQAVRDAGAREVYGLTLTKTWPGEADSLD